jgi:hypothetical protein
MKIIDLTFPYASHTTLADLDSVRGKECDEHFKKTYKKSLDGPANFARL